jgi:hypothetical protein
MANPRKATGSTAHLDPKSREVKGFVTAHAAYVVETTAGYVNVPADKVLGKTDEELEAWLRSDDYFSRIGGHHILKVTHETVLKIVL